MEGVRVQKLQTSNEIRKVTSEIFVDAYYKNLLYFSKNKEVLAKAFYKSFLLEHFYGAFINNELVGIFALTDEKERCFRIIKEDFIKNFGLIKGYLAYLSMKNELEHPIKLKEKGYFIEAVAVKVEKQGHGVGKAMMKYAIENNEYLELDVVDTNIAAIKLYEKLGFKIFKEVPEKYFKKAKGFNKRLYMYYDPAHKKRRAS